MISEEHNAVITDMFDFLQYSRTCNTYSGTCCFRIRNNDQDIIRTVRVTPGHPVVIYDGLPPDGNITVDLSLNYPTFRKLYDNSMSANYAVMTGKLQVKYLKYGLLSEFVSSFDMSTEKWHAYYKWKKEQEIQEQMVNQAVFSHGNEALQLLGSDLEMNDDLKTLFQNLVKITVLTNVDDIPGLTNNVPEILTGSNESLTNAVIGLHNLPQTEDIEPMKEHLKQVLNPINDTIHNPHLEGFLMRIHDHTHNMVSDQLDDVHMRPSMKDPRVISKESVFYNSVATKLDKVVYEMPKVMTNEYVKENSENTVGEYSNVIRKIVKDNDDQVRLFENNLRALVNAVGDVRNLHMEIRKQRHNQQQKQLLACNHENHEKHNSPPLSSSPLPEPLSGFSLPTHMSAYMTTPPFITPTQQLFKSKQSSWFSMLDFDLAHHVDTVHDSHFNSKYNNHTNTNTNINAVSNSSNQDGNIDGSYNNDPKMTRFNVNPFFQRDNLSNLCETVKTQVFPTETPSTESSIPDLEDVTVSLNTSPTSSLSPSSNIFTHSYKWVKPDPHTSDASVTPIDKDDVQVDLKRLKNMFLDKCNSMSHSIKRLTRPQYTVETSDVDQSNEDYLTQYNVGKFSGYDYHNSDLKMVRNRILHNINLFNDAVNIPITVKNHPDADPSPSYIDVTDDGVGDYNQDSSFMGMGLFDHNLFENSSISLSPALSDYSIHQFSGQNDQQQQMLELVPHFQSSSMASTLEAALSIYDTYRHQKSNKSGNPQSNISQMLVSSALDLAVKGESLDYIELESIIDVNSCYKQYAETVMTRTIRGTDLPIEVEVAEALVGGISLHPSPTPSQHSSSNTLGGDIVVTPAMKAYVDVLSSVIINNVYHRHDVSEGWFWGLFGSNTNSATATNSLSTTSEKQAPTLEASELNMTPLSQPHGQPARNTDETTHIEDSLWSTITSYFLGTSEHESTEATPQTVEPVSTSPTHSGTMMELAKEDAENINENIIKPYIRHIQNKLRKRAETPLEVPFDVQPDYLPPLNTNTVSPLPTETYSNPPLNNNTEIPSITRPLTDYDLRSKLTTFESKLLLRLFGNESKFNTYFKDQF